MTPANHPGTHPTYQPNDTTYEALTQLVAPYSLSRIQLAEAIGIATKPTVNTWVKQCCPNLPQGAPVPLEPILRYLHETHLPNPKKWPGNHPYDQYILENITARMLARAVATTFSGANYRKLVTLTATLILLTRYWDGPNETFLTLLDPQPSHETEEHLQQAIKKTSNVMRDILNDLLLPTLHTARGTYPTHQAHLLTSYALAAGYYAGNHPHETLNSIHTSLAAADRTNALPDAELTRYVADFLNAGSYATHDDAALGWTHPSQRNLILHGSYGSYETATQLIAHLPHAHHAIAFSAPEGTTSALAPERRDAFTLYLCYLLLDDEDSTEKQAADLYRAEHWATQQTHTTNRVAHAETPKTATPEPEATLPDAPANHLLILPLDTPAGGPDDLAVQQNDAWDAIENLALTVDENISLTGTISYPLRPGEHLAVLAPLDVLAGFGRHLKADQRNNSQHDNFLENSEIQARNHGMRLRAVIDLGPEHLKVNTKTRLGLGLLHIFNTGEKPQGSVYLGSLDDMPLYQQTEHTGMPELTTAAAQIQETACGYLTRGEITPEDISSGVIVASNALKNASFDELFTNPASINTPVESLSLLTSLTRKLPALLETLPGTLNVDVPHLRTPEDRQSIPRGEEHDITITHLVSTEKVLTKITGRQIHDAHYGDLEGNLQRIRVLDTHTLGHYSRYGVLPAEGHYLRSFNLSDTIHLTQANDIVVYPSYDQTHGGPAVYLSEHGGEAIDKGLTVLRFSRYTPGESNAHTTREYRQRAQLLAHLLQALLRGLTEGTAFGISTHMAPEKRKAAANLKGWEKKPLPYIDALAGRTNDLEWFSEPIEEPRGAANTAAEETTAEGNGDAPTTHPVARYLANQLNAFDTAEAALAEALHQIRAVRSRYERDLMDNRLDIRSTQHVAVTRKNLEAEELARILRAVKAEALGLAVTGEPEIETPLGYPMELPD